MQTLKIALLFGGWAGIAVTWGFLKVRGGLPGQWAALWDSLIPTVSSVLALLSGLGLSGLLNDSTKAGVARLLGHRGGFVTVLVLLYGAAAICGWVAHQRWPAELECVPEASLHARLADRDPQPCGPRFWIHPEELITVYDQESSIVSGPLKTVGSSWVQGSYRIKLSARDLFTSRWRCEQSEPVPDVQPFSGCGQPREGERWSWSDTWQLTLKGPRAANAKDGTSRLHVRCAADGCGLALQMDKSDCPVRLGHDKPERNRAELPVIGDCLDDNGEFLAAHVTLCGTERLPAGRARQTVVVELRSGEIPTTYPLKCERSAATP
jgi:hypothetical protein